MITKIKRIWEFKYLIYNLVLRDLKVKYKGSTMGFLWSLLNPLLMLAVYTIAFKYLIKIRQENFVVFLFTGMIPWNFLSAGVSMGVGSITDNASLVKKVYFPREVLPLSVVLVNLFHFFLTLFVLLPVLLLFDVTLSFSFLLLPVLIIFQTFFVLGLTLAVSALNVYYRDAKHLLEVLLQVWFWGTPIIWSLEMIPEKYRLLAHLNPFTPFVTAFRDVILENRVPDLLTFAVISVLGIAVMVGGTMIFQAKQRRFAEEI
ncbi:MAG: ABC transporter permease [bacterium]|nr:ABC transporter permease [bacterium]